MSSDGCASQAQCKFQRQQDGENHARDSCTLPHGSPITFCQVWLF